MKPILTLPTLLTLTTAATIPLTRRAGDSSDLCAQYATLNKGFYTLHNNLWGQDNAKNGSQCTGLGSANGSTIAWYSSWTWTGGEGQVKSFPNAALQFDAKTLSDMKSIQTKWEWNYTGTNITADVAYDLFLSSTATGSSKYEIMIWLATLGGAGPISSSGQSIASTTIAGASWDLYWGKNGDMQVYSFVAADEAKGFEGDSVDFFAYLEKNKGLDSGLYLTDVQAGTEPFEGNEAVFTTESFEVEVA